MHVQADVTDLVKKAGATLSFLKHSSLIRHRPSKCTPHMAEEFAFKERLGERPAVYRYKGAPGPGTMLVNGSSDQLFAGTAFSENQHRTSSGSHSSHGLVDLYHGSAFADDRPGLISVSIFFFAFPCPVSERPLRQRSGDGLLELLQVHRLGDEIKSSFMDRFDGGFY